MANSGKRLISKVLMDQSLSLPLERGISPDYFPDSDSRRVWDFLVQHFTKYQDVPSAVTVKKNYPTYKLLNVSETMDFLVDEVVKERKDRMAYSMLQEAVGHVGDQKFDKALDVLRSGLISLDSVGINYTSSVDLTVNPEERLNEYLARRTTNGMIGIPTGFPTIDKATSGLQPEQLTTCVAGPKAGKALDVDTPILTSNRGWVRNGDLVAGDYVFAPDGTPTEVVFAHPVRHGNPCFEVTTKDGQSIVADAVHLWTGYLHKGKGPKTWTTVEILEAMQDTGRNFTLDVPRALEYPEADLPVSPYTFGVWLGDGTSSSGSITLNHVDSPDILRVIKEEGWEILHPTAVRGSSSRYTVSGLQPILRGMGVLHNKHIPSEYLRGSVEQRLRLLRGIMDTDGYVGERNLGEITQVNEGLAQQVLFLLRSLGYKASLSEGRATIDGRDVGPKYRVTFTADPEVTSISKHRYKITGSSSSRRKTLSIVSVQPVDSVPVRCITVRRSDGMYLAGTGLLPTHNSTLKMKIAIHVHSQGHSVMFQSFEMSNTEQKERHDAMRAKVALTRVRSGHLTTEDEKALKKMYADMNGLPPFTLEDASEGMTVSALASKVARIKPGVLFVDGVYLMRDEVTGDSGTPQAITNITRALKRLAQVSKIPVVISTQTLLWKMKGRKTSAEAIGYSSSFVQDSDVVLGLDMGEDDSKQDERTLKIIASRNSGLAEVGVRWDWRSGVFREFSSGEMEEVSEEMLEEELGEGYWLNSGYDASYNWDE